MSTPLDRAGAALLPAEGLARLAGQRCRGDVQVVIDEGGVWVTWPAGGADVWQPLLAAPGVTFFERRGGHWYALGQHLPRFDVPPRGEPRRLDALLVPVPVRPVPASGDHGPPVQLGVAPSEGVRPATALRADLADLRPWAESAPSAELRACRAAVCGGRVILRGSRLPAIPRAERFWGERVLVPLGFRPEPDLPETALRTAAGVELGELLLLTESGAEAVPDSAFAPLTRAALRLGKS